MNLEEHTATVGQMLSTTFPNHNIKELKFKDISYFDTFPDKPSVFLQYEFLLVPNKSPSPKHMMKEIAGYTSIGLTIGSLSTLTINPLKPL